jgi:predicted unusual protein kinase regulating ubiquinone biosynthesis (AarF/ABC1/UbiB family)
VSKDELEGIPRGWGRRLLSTGKIAASAARLAARRVVSSPEGEADGHIGEALARELDQMKGMAMKVGQILSYFDGTLPPETHRALRVLQRGAKPVAFDRMARVIEEAFGQPVDTLFEEIDPAPVAAASIGQVHRARFEGHPVAVKVQYPGIRDTMSADFGRLRSLSRLASVATAVDGLAIVNELRERVDEECDYDREAAHQAAFAAAFARDRNVDIPAVVLERTRETVLTTEWSDGQDFYAFQASADEGRQSEAGLVLARFALFSLFELGTVNADPHPGNYLFPPDGRVVFLDFGCVRRFDAEFLEAHRDLVAVVVSDQRSLLEEAMAQTGMVGRPQGFDYDLHWEMLCHEYAPYREPDFRFTADYVRAGLEYSRPSNPNLRKLAIPPQWIWLERLTWGLHAVLARLGAEGPFADIMRDALSRPRVGLPEAPAGS